MLGLPELVAEPLSTFFSDAYSLAIADVRVRRPHRQPHELRIVVGDLVEELGVHVHDVVARRGRGVLSRLSLTMMWSSAWLLPSKT